MRIIYVLLVIVIVSQVSHYLGDVLQTDTQSPVWSFKAQPFKAQPIKTIYVQSIQPTPLTQPIQPDEYRVVQVTDGDTIQIEYGNSIRSVRFIGLDTPEKWTKKTGYSECYGEEASAYAHTFFSGGIVKLVFDDSQSHVDTYDRLLAHVYLPDGTNYEESALHGGYGFKFIFNGIPSRFELSYAAAESFARQNTLGVWGACNGKLKRKLY